MSFGDAAESWHAGRLGLAQTTRARDRSILDALVLPTLGPMPLRGIDAAILREWISAMDAAGKAPSTIAKAVSMVRAVFARAVDDRVLIRNPAASGLELPTRSAAPLEVLTAQQVADLVAAPGPLYGVLLDAAAGTGMRWGELAGLTVSDVDPLRSELRVRRQLVELAGRLDVSDRLKTARTYRVVTLPRRLD